MDPNRCLEEQLALARKFLDIQDGNDSDLIEEVDVFRLSELVLSLDEWIRKGGFLPKAWVLKGDGG